MSVNPSQYEQLMLELINWARATPAAQASMLGIDLNASLPAGTISGAAKQPLVFNDKLIDAARLHSDWMLATDTFSHTGVSGSSPGDRMAAAGYVFANGWGWGENIAWGGSTGSIDIGSQTVDLHEGLFLSSGHRVNLMNPAFVEIGVGILQGVFVSGGTGYNAAMATQKFAYSGNQSYLTGVVIDDVNRNDFYDLGEGVGGASIMATGTTGTFTTTSWDAGGYNLALPAGSYMVTFSFAGKETTSNVTIGNDNVKLDARLADMQFASAGPVPIWSGTAGNDHYMGDDSNNLFRESGGSDLMDGRAGFDIVSYFGPRANYSVDGGAQITVQKPGGGTDTLISIDRLQFTDGYLAFDFDGVAGQAFRLYQAAFDRTPDTPGLSYWIGRLDSGTTNLDAVADSFLDSPEFVRTYGTESTVSNPQFIELLYLHTLGRAYEQSGFDYWVERLDGGHTNRGDLLAYFSESDENVARVAPAIEDGIWFV